MNFTYKESKSGHDMLTLKTDQHVEVEVLFEDNKATEIYLDGQEFSLNCDTLHGIFVIIGGEIYSLVALANIAEKNYYRVTVEAATEALEAATNALLLSCPRATGRI